MNKKIKGFVMTAAACAMISSLTACGGGGTETGSNDTITYWVALSANAAQTVSNLGDTPFAKALMEKTGTKIEYQHPAQGQEGEKFNIMIAMGKLPDIIEYAWTKNYPGGPEKALSDGIIQEINPETEAPNLYAYLKQRPDVDKFMKTDSGKYYGWAFVRGDEYLQTSAGPIVRQDWLDELGLERPETIDDWTNMLTAFKEKKGAKVPLSMNTGGITAWGTFVGAYNTFDGLYIKDGTVTYGPLEDSYKDFLAQMNDWYKKGLLDPDYATIDAATIQSNILNGLSGATYGSCGSGIGKWMAASQEEGFNLSGVKYPVLKRGDKPQFGSYEFPVTGASCSVISRDCKDKERCAKLLDFAFSEEGSMLYNFGVEGESYTMIDGYPTYTEDITNNKEGLSMSAALARYTLSHNTGSFVQDKRYMEQYAQLPQQKEALTNWMDINMKEHLMPNVSITVEQQNEIATLIENIDTYRAEMQSKFIMGIEPIENFDKFRDELKTRGVEKYLKYEQEAYDRFMAR